MVGFVPEIDGDSFVSQQDSFARKERLAKEAGNRIRMPRGVDVMQQRFVGVPSGLGVPHRNRGREIRAAFKHAPQHPRLVNDGILAEIVWDIRRRALRIVGRNIRFRKRWVHYVGARRIRVIAHHIRQRRVRYGMPGVKQLAQRDDEVA